MQEMDEIPIESKKETASVSGSEAQPEEHGKAVCSFVVPSTHKLTLFSFINEHASIVRKCQISGGCCVAADE